MKKLHLICNAHLDPVWQWTWDEAAAATIATFASAVKLCDEFDYIFCHNEVLLYKYIEEYAPDIFIRIQELVKQGKWHIMGGWFLQPDCNMPSGESFVRQIQIGKIYFKNKFGAETTTAINFDSFGHSRGLVQIICKSGQDSYIITRPNNCDSLFKWKGFDGSCINVARCSSYGTPLGKAAEAIKGCTEEDKDIGLKLWGVGNHGGGPSRKDLRDIQQLQNNSDVEIIHSTPERYFSEINTVAEYDKTLRISMPGCYTSMSLIKQKHIELEHSLYLTEKIVAAASLAGIMEYPQEKLSEAVEDLLISEFHDILPGTSVIKGEEYGLQILFHGLLTTSKLRTKALFALSRGMEVAKDGEFPVIVFNPNPYKLKTAVECEFNLPDQNWTDKTTRIKVYDDEKLLKSQILKEESTINLDWRKKVIFECELEPMQVKRFSFYTNLIDKQEKIRNLTNNIIFDNGKKHIEINECGLIDKYSVDNIEYANGNLFEPYLYDDNADPWGMGAEQLKQMGTNPVAIPHLKNPDGIFAGMKPIQIIEDGDIYLGVESFFGNEHVKIRLEYRIYKNNEDIDIIADVYWMTKNKMLKLHIPTTQTGNYLGQTAFGTDILAQDGSECVSQRFVAKQGNEKVLGIINNCIYGSSCINNEIHLSLLRGVGYCVHPIPERKLYPDDRFINGMDMGNRKFAFQLTVCNEDELERKALEFNERPYALNIFPVMSKRNSESVNIICDNKNIVLITLKKSEMQEGYIIRLLNNSSQSKECVLKVEKSSILLTFVIYEVKTIIYNKELTESKNLII